MHLFPNFPFIFGYRSRKYWKWEYYRFWELSNLDRCRIYNLNYIKEDNSHGLNSTSFIQQSWLGVHDRLTPLVQWIVIVYTYIQIFGSWKIPNIFTAHSVRFNTGKLYNNNLAETSVLMIFQPLSEYNSPIYADGMCSQVLR